MASRSALAAFTAALVAVLLLGHAQAQSVLQSGPTVSGHVPMYELGPGGGFAAVMDSGFASGLSAAGTQTGAGLSEFLQINHDPGSGPFGTHTSLLDNPIGTVGGYHGLSFDANAQGGGLITYNAFAGASPLPLKICANGTCAAFPFSTTGVIGPTTSAIPDIACWNNTSGTLLADCGVPSPTQQSVTGFFYAPETQPTISVGTALAPISAVSATMAFEKFWDTSIGSAPGGNIWQHPTLYSVCHLQTIGSDPNYNACRGMMAEGIDNVGGFGTFVEGGKFVGVETQAAFNTHGFGGGAYGVVGWGQSWDSQFTVGVEAETLRTNGTDAPGPGAFNPSSQLMVGFLYSNGIGSTGNRADVGFLVNPFNTVKTSSGFACGKNAIEGTAGTCFSDYGGSALGMDLSLGVAVGLPAPHSIGAMLLANTDPVYIRKVAPSMAIANVLYLGGDNVLHLGTDAQVNIEHAFVVGGNVNFQSVPTGTPVASLCIDAGGNIIKKTTTGPCV